MAKTLYDRVNEIKTKHLSPQSVTGDKVPINTIEEKHIANQAVRARHLGPDVPAIGIADGSVTESKLAANSVVSGKIKAGAVGSSELASGAVTPEKAALGFGRFVPRATFGTTPDYRIHQLTPNQGSWQVDGLDVSTIVPSGAIGVLVKMAILGGESGCELHIAGDSTASPLAVMSLAERSFTTGNMVRGENVGVLPISPDRKLDYYLKDHATLCNEYHPAPGRPALQWWNNEPGLGITVLGWYI